MTHFHVFWKFDGSQGPAFAGDVMAHTPGEAMRIFISMFPEDQVLGIKYARGDGRWVA